MIRIEQIKLRIGQESGLLYGEAAKILRIAEQEILSLHMVKRSLDARKKPDLFYSYIIDVEMKKEAAVWKRLAKGRSGRIAAGKHFLSLQQPQDYIFPIKRTESKKERPIVVGMGPAGLFCAYFLAREGYRPILLERGKDVDARLKDVEAFWEGGALNPESNVQFGEGGAGTFSDGKLNTLVKDTHGRNREVLRLFTEFGAPKEILFDNKPHIGTDILRSVVKNMRAEIIRLGGEIHFQSQVTELALADNRVEGVVVNGEQFLPARAVVLAIGHSARNTFSMLYEKGIPMEAKPFAVGFRVEHRQKLIDESMYGAVSDVVADALPAAAYKVTAKTEEGRGVYSFCMCPGGYVVNASSEPDRLCTNGMSYSGRDGANANSAVIVAVTPKDYGDSHPLAGIAFQRRLEEKAYLAGAGRVPVQTYGSFRECMEKGTTVKPDKDATFEPAVKGEYVFTDITKILPEKLNKGIVEGMEQFGRQIEGFDRPDTLLSAVESRTSSPVRILRDDALQSEVRGLFPCGEGAGYAGGITSAAMDGIKVAEAVAAALTGTGDAI
ncbi:MAG: NAD(P)-binding protein [Lachnospiraceae bacterium]|nr:NAD(P)-binding protein [Lachnospiraceae bacterium]